MEKETEQNNPPRLFASEIILRIFVLIFVTLLSMNAYYAGKHLDAHEYGYALNDSLLCFLFLTLIIFEAIIFIF